MLMLRPETWAIRLPEICRLLRAMADRTLPLLLSGPEDSSSTPAPPSDVDCMPLSRTTGGGVADNICGQNTAVPATMSDGTCMKPIFRSTVKPDERLSAPVPESVKLPRICSDDDDDWLVWRNVKDGTERTSKVELGWQENAALMETVVPEKTDDPRTASGWSTEKFDWMATVPSTTMASCTDRVANCDLCATVIEFASTFPVGKTTGNETVLVEKTALQMQATTKQKRINSEAEAMETFCQG